MHGGSVAVTMTPACAEDFAHTVLPKAGRYKLAELPTMSWIVKKTCIRDADGNIVSNIGSQQHYVESAWRLAALGAAVAEIRRHCNRRVHRQ